MGTKAREPTPDEASKMAELVRRGMDESAFGLSSGLFLHPRLTGARDGKVLRRR